MLQAVLVLTSLFDVGQSYDSCLHFKLVGVYFFTVLDEEQRIRFMIKKNK